MKKLFCLSLFVMGIFVSVQAQILTYQLNNVSSTDTWFYKMQDANGNSTSVTIAPLGTITGAFGNFALPIEWKAEDINGCGTSGFITGVGSNQPTYLCTSPSAMKYDLSLLGFNFYFLQWKFD